MRKPELHISYCLDASTSRYGVARTVATDRRMLGPCSSDSNSDYKQLDDDKEQGIDAAVTDVSNIEIGRVRAEASCLRFRWTGNRDAENLLLLDIVLCVVKIFGSRPRLNDGPSVYKRQKWRQRAFNLAQNSLSSWSYIAKEMYPTGCRSWRNY